MDELVLKAHVVRGRLVFSERSRAKLNRFMDALDKSKYTFVTIKNPEKTSGYRKFYFGVLLPTLIDQIGEYKPLLDAQLRDIFGYGQDLSDYNLIQWKAFVQSIINYFELDV